MTAISDKYAQLGGPGGPLVIAERDAESDPFLKRQLAAAVARITSELSAVTARAQTAGCL